MTSLATPSVRQTCHLKAQAGAICFLPYSLSKPVARSRVTTRPSARHSERPFRCNAVSIEPAPSRPQSPVFADAVAGWLQQACPQTTDFARSKMEEHALAWAEDSAPAGTLCVAAAQLQGQDSVLFLLVAILDQPAHELRVHWACSKGQGRAWSAPPAGWHTLPTQSQDAGYGAWQTSMQAVGAVGHAGPSCVHAALLQVPLTGPLSKRDGRVALVLTTGLGQWAKKVSSGQLTDAFISTQSLPVINTPGLVPSTPSSNTSAAVNHDSKQSSSDNGSGRSQGNGKLVQEQQSRHLGSTQVLEVQGMEAGIMQAAAAQLQDRSVMSVSEEVAQLGVKDARRLEQFLVSFQYSLRPAEDFTVTAGNSNKPGRLGPCQWMLDAIDAGEHGAERSLMHRFGLGADLFQRAAGCTGGEHLAAVTAVVVWLRFSALRLLVWNRSYNIKPREISTAQDRLCTVIGHLWATSPSAGQVPDVRPLLRLALSSVGRGGAGDVGQRVRDEILAVQSRNNCKGGMMEEWHQKLHNNTSPDDIAICEALLAYCKNGLDIKAYWQHLAASNIDAARLASFDRPIRNEPHFSSGQVPGLVRDLSAYLLTLKAVHGGTDLATAAKNVIGYTEHSMKGSKPIVVEPVPKIANKELQVLLASALHLQALMAQHDTTNRSSQAGLSHATSTNVQHAQRVGWSLRLMELLMEARHRLRPAVLAGDAACGGRHRDVLFLDLALEAAARTCVEGVLGDLRATAQTAAAGKTGSGKEPAVSATAAVPAKGPSTREELSSQVENGSVTLLQALTLLSGTSADGTTGAEGNQQGLRLLLKATHLAVENAALSAYPNDELTWAVKWMARLNTSQGLQQDELLQALSVLDRLKRALEAQCADLGAVLQPTADALGRQLGLTKAAQGSTRHTDHTSVAVSQLSEEIIRGGAAAPLSQVISVLEPCLRKLVGAGDWQIVSRGEPLDGSPAGPKEGRVVVTQQLASVQYNSYGEPTVLLVEQLAGDEEVPAGCVAVLSIRGSCPDMLSHSAVRARNMGVVLAALRDDKRAEELRGWAGRRVRVGVQGQAVSVAPV